MLKDEFTMQTANSEQPTLYLVAPAYNESENIKNFVEEWYPVVERHNGGGLSRLVVVDDGSKDDTYKILQNMAGTRELLLPLTKPNSGHGPALIYGYKYAASHGADYIFQTDTDGQTSADEFESFWNEIGNYDAVLGKRSVRGDGKSRKFVENVLCFVVRMIFGVKVPDANCPFRLMRSDLVRKYISMLPEDFNLPNVMLTVCLAYFRNNIVFREITFKPRQGGKNFINVKRIIQIGMKAVSDFRQLRKKIFVIPCMAVILLFRRKSALYFVVSIALIFACYGSTRIPLWLDEYFGLGINSISLWARSNIMYTASVWCLLLYLVYYYFRLRRKDQRVL